MKPQWFSHLKSQEEKDRFKELVLSSHKVLDRLKDICYNNLTKTSDVTSNDYDVASWAFKQAHLNGKAEAYREMLSLLDFPEHK